MFSLQRISKTICLLYAVAAAIGSPAQSFKTVVNFNYLTDGSESVASLVQGTDGNFYGTTEAGGGSGDFSPGTVFKVTPDGELTILYDFCAQTPCTEGWAPQAGLIQAIDGNFYGTTSVNSTAFQITPNGTLTTIYTFCSQTNCADGYLPSGLMQAADGDFYGVNAEGGVSTICQAVEGCGTIFKLTSNGTLTILYSFCAQTNCSDGSYPAGGLIQDGAGDLYGTTSYGGANTLGTVFKLSSSGILTTLHSFCAPGCLDGDSPNGALVQGSDGTLYGTTMFGGAHGAGTVFKITPAGVLTTLYSFCAETGCPDGANPMAALIFGADGNLYGTTSAARVRGLTRNGYGSVFRITPGGTLTTLHSFNWTDGAGPVGGLVQDSNGNFYGTTPLGGAHESGTVFSLTVFNLPGVGEQVDYFGEFKADFTVWRPSGGTWYSIDGSGKSLTKAWGLSSDKPVVGDYDGDGKTDVAVWRPSTGTWWVTQSSTSQVVTQQWGEKGDIPVPGDYDGDGETDYAVWRPSTGTWYVLQSSNGQVISKEWGVSGDIPVPGDYDGDGKTDMAIWRPSTGTWYIIQSSTGSFISKQWGASTDKAVPGDYDGDGITDMAVWRPSTGTWMVIQSSTGKTVTQPWGTKGDIPVPRDYDGDGKTDYAVWRPSTGNWFVIDSSNNKTVSQKWGISTDIPMNKPVGQ